MTVASVVRVVWLLTFAIFVGIGVGLVWLPASASIESLRREASHYYEEAVHNEDEVRNAAKLEAMHVAVEDDLRSLTHAGTTGQATTALLTLLAGESRQYRVSVRAIVPSAVASPSTGPFDETNVQFTLAGRFADVLAFVADLPRRDTLIEIRDMTLAATDGRASHPELTVTIHAVLYRYRVSATAGGYHVASSV